jgi:hypothetical protein
LAKVRIFILYRQILFCIFFRFPVFLTVQSGKRARQRIGGGFRSRPRRGVASGIASAKDAGEGCFVCIRGVFSNTVDGNRIAVDVRSDAVNDGHIEQNRSFSRIQ